MRIELTQIMIFQQMEINTYEYVFQMNSGS